MIKHKINIKFDIFTLRRPAVTGIIQKCVEASLMQQKVALPCEINVLITDDSGIRAINRAYRDIDNATDVLSFPMFQFVPGQPPEEEACLDPETGLCPLGDMAISLERAILQANEYGHTVRREIGYLTIHSMLHLLGYDHMDEAEEKALMRQQEEIIAASLKRMAR